LGAVVSSALYRDYKVDVEFAYNRKEAKDHGEGGVLVGASMNGKRILIIDDVITAGTAIRESYNLLQSIGAIPIGVTVALDRAEKVSLDDPISAVQGVVRDFNIPVIPIITLPQIQSYLERNSAKYDSDSLHQVKVYRELYGVM
jgi:orotate phosphoribosyltransferase